MAKTNSKALVVTERPNKVIDQIIRSNVSRAKKGVADWRTALQNAEKVENPKRLQLYNLYDEIVLDAHVSAEIDRRLLAFVGTEWQLIDEQGKPDVEAGNTINKQWFLELMEHAWFSKAWGHSLIEIKNITSDGMVHSVNLVPRRHVLVEKGIVIKNQADEKGLLYRIDPATYQWLFEFGIENDLGFLNKCAPHVLYKRFVQGAWTEFCEVFGMPVRIAKTETKDKESLRKLDAAMASMSTAFYAVIDKEEEIDFLQAATSDGRVYESLMNYCSAEISKLINGAVIGEDSKGGSRSKEEVGLKLIENKQMADKRWFEIIMNEQILPKLITLGYPVQGKIFEFVKNKDVATHWKMVNEMLTNYDIEPEYIQEHFNVPVSKKNSVQEPIKVSKGAKGFFE
jgi:phage gp29-like protein